MALRTGLANVGGMTPQSALNPIRALVIAADPVVAGPLDAAMAPLASLVPERITTAGMAISRRLAAAVDVILVDLAIAGDDEVAELCRASGEASPVAVVGLLRHDCPLRTANALRAGVQECLVVTDLTSARLERSLRQAVERHRVQQQLADLALRDELTGLYNRRGILAFGEFQRRQCLRAGRTLVVVQLDLDGLKVINDTWGHAAGDQAIAGTAAILRCTFRESDIVGRLGGDEFVALAIDADAAAIHRVERRLSLALDAHNVRQTTPFKLSFSIGTSVLIPPASPTLAELFGRADAELYRAKRASYARAGRWVPPAPAYPATPHAAA
jgi:two-component system cell cycle response regulator